MKKIENIKQLKVEKQKLIQKQYELESAIKYDWRDPKGSLMPANISEQFFSKMFDEKKGIYQNSMVAETLSQLASSFTKKIVVSAENKIREWFRNRSK